MKHGLYVRLTVLSMIVLTVVFTSLPSLAADKKAKERLAVLDLEAKYGIEKNFAEALSVIVRDKLHSYGEYQVMSKGDLQAVASREQLLQAIGCDDGKGQCLVDFGRAIGTRFMVAGDISKIGSTYTVSLRMLDTKGDSAGVTNRVSENCKCDDDALIGTVQDVAARLIGKPTAVAEKKAEEARKLALEKKKAEESIAADEKKKAEADAIKRSVDEDKKRLAAEIESLKKEKERVVLEGEQKRLTAEKSKTTSTTSPVNQSQTTNKTHIDPATAMEFVYVPGGCFQMGSPSSDLQRRENEEPVHEVCLDAFYMGKHEVTGGQYKSVMGEVPRIKSGSNYPVDELSWNDAQSFINKLNSISKKNYRLPTEAEWEYAARAGTTTPFCFGNNILTSQANFGGNFTRDGKKYKSQAQTVGSYPPNSFGLYDMHGNVWEWCQDWYNKDYYKSSFNKNPSGPPSGSERIARGGSGLNYPKDLRSASRFGFDPDYRSNFFGFRLVLPISLP